jgi:hypothetical protein
MVARALHRIAEPTNWAAFGISNFSYPTLNDSHEWPDGRDSRDATVAYPYIGG